MCLQQNADLLSPTAARANLFKFLIICFCSRIDKEKFQNVTIYALFQITHLSKIHRQTINNVFILINNFICHKRRCYKYLLLTHCPVSRVQMFLCWPRLLLRNFHFVFSKIQKYCWGRRHKNCSSSFNFFPLYDLSYIC